MPATYKVLIAAFCGCLVLAACRCDQDCPAFDTALLTYMPYNVGDSIRYTNSNGTQIAFGVTGKTTSGAYHDDGKQTEFGCQKQECTSNALLKGGSPTQRNGEHGLYFELHDGDDYKMSMLDLLDFSLPNQYKTRELITGKGATVYATMSLGPHQYSNIFAYTLDTLARPNQNVWRVWLVKDGGIVGFDDRQTHTLFYLQ